MMNISLRSMENQLLREFCIMHMHIPYLCIALLKENGNMFVSSKNQYDMYIHVSQCVISTLVQ